MAECGEEDPIVSDRKLVEEHVGKSPCKQNLSTIRAAEMKERLRKKHEEKYKEEQITSKKDEVPQAIVLEITQEDMNFDLKPHQAANSDANDKNDEGIVADGRPHPDPNRGRKKVKPKMRAVQLNVQYTNGPDPRLSSRGDNVGMPADSGISAAKVDYWADKQYEEDGGELWEDPNLPQLPPPGYGEIVAGWKTQSDVADPSLKTDAPTKPKTKMPPPLVEKEETEDWVVAGGAKGVKALKKKMRDEGKGRSNSIEPNAKGKAMVNKFAVLNGKGNQPILNNSSDDDGFDNRNNSPVVEYSEAKILERIDAAVAQAHKIHNSAMERALLKVEQIEADRKLEQIKYKKLQEECAQMRRALDEVVQRKDELENHTFSLTNDNLSTDGKLAQMRRILAEKAVQYEQLESERMELQSFVAQNEFSAMEKDAHNLKLSTDLKRVLEEFNGMTKIFVDEMMIVDNGFISYCKLENRTLNDLNHLDVFLNTLIERFTGTSALQSNPQLFSGLKTLTAAIKHCISNSRPVMDQLTVHLRELRESARNRTLTEQQIEMVNLPPAAVDIYDFLTSQLQAIIAQPVPVFVPQLPRQTTPVPDMTDLVQNILENNAFSQYRNRVKVGPPTSENGDSSSSMQSRRSVSPMPRQSTSPMPTAVAKSTTPVPTPLPRPMATPMPNVLPPQMQRSSSKTSVYSSASVKSDVSKSTELAEAQVSRVPLSYIPPPKRNMNMRQTNPRLEPDYETPLFTPIVTESSPQKLETHLAKRADNRPGFGSFNASRSGIVGRNNMSPLAGQNNLSSYVSNANVSSNSVQSSTMSSTAAIPNKPEANMKITATLKLKFMAACNEMRLPVPEDANYQKVMMEMCMERKDRLGSVRNYNVDAESDFMQMVNTMINKWKVVMPQDQFQQLNGVTVTIVGVEDYPLHLIEETTCKLCDKCVIQDGQKDEILYECHKCNSVLHESCLTKIGRGLLCPCCSNG